jgi:hypothetical protein
MLNGNKESDEEMGGWNGDRKLLLLLLGVPFGSTHLLKIRICTHTPHWVEVIECIHG